MLQRAASNAYSWWWASHIRTKQSKWLEQNLQDMEEKVDTVLKLIEGDGDSFAKRAEMYYKKRPELISFVEESYRAYRSLAERYDNISTELQNANNTIATVFPERVQFAMDEDDEHVSSPRTHKLPVPHPKSNIPNVPKLPSRDLKGLLSTATNNIKAKKGPKEAAMATKKEVMRSGLSKAEAIREIDRLQKGILSLQTEKEFVKISYEHGLAKYWEIDEQIREKHERICSLQDEFSVGKAIEDGEARTLMAASALRSCQESLANLQMKQEISANESKFEHERIQNARIKWNSLKSELVPNNHVEQDTLYEKEDGTTNEGNLIEEQGVATTQERQQLESLREKIKEYFEVGSNATLTVTEMVENIDELVNKVISLETAVLSQTALIKRLRTETDELQAQITSLEDGKSNLIHGSDDMTRKVREMEEKLHQVQDLNQNVENQNNNLQTHFTQAHCSLDKLTEKLDNVQPDEEQESMLPGPVEVIEKVDHVNTAENLEEITSSLQQEEGGKDSGVQAVVEKDVQTFPSKECDDEKVPNQDDNQDAAPDAALDVEVDGSNWQKLFSNGLENKEKIILKEYTTILRNYKEVKRQLGEVEKKNRDSLMETTVQLNKLKNANGTKDEEIQSLRQKLSFLVTSMADNPDMKELKDSIEGQDVQPQTHLPDSNATESTKQGEEDEDEDEEEKVIRIDECDTNSAIEGMFRMKIDELLGENLDFWLNFSSTFHQIQKFQTSVEDLQSEIVKLEERLKKKKQEGSVDKDTCLKSDARPLYKHLREIETEVTLWLEQSVLLKDEMQNRITSLCNIQEEISKALKDSCQEEEMKFTSYQAAKFQGEVLNMKQENSKVSQELQAGLDHAVALQLDIQKTLAKLDDDFELSGTKNSQNSPIRHSTSRGRIPLRSFIFGVKQKKQRMSIFSSMHPALHRKHTDVRSTHTS